MQSLSSVWLSVTPWTAARQASLSITNSRSLFKLMSVKSVMLSNHLILCLPLLLPSVFPSIKSLFQWISSLHQVAKVLEFELQHQCFQWIFRTVFFLSFFFFELICFRIDWSDLLAVQGTLESLLQHHSSKASTLQHSTFFIVKLSHPYMTTGKSVALSRPTFVGKVMSLLFNMLSRFVIAFLTGSKCLLISKLLSTICRDFGAQEHKKTKSLICCHSVAKSSLTLQPHDCSMPGSCVLHCLIKC